VSSWRYTVRAASWAVDAVALQSVRRAVFVVEQRIPEELEWDAADAQCVHALAFDGQDAPIGCGRLLLDGHIGRMAVLAPWRGRGVGDALLTRLMAIAHARGHAHVMLNAQTQAQGFYARRGFVARGPVFDEAGIAHRLMTRALP